MNRGHRQIVAEKVGSTVRMLELLGLEYQVTGPKNRREKGNKSPRVVHVTTGKGKVVRVYNSVNGYTWANAPNGEPVADVKSIEDLRRYLEGLGN